jgi:hypothetical protein
MISELIKNQSQIILIFYRESLLTGAVHLFNFFRAKLFINNEKLFDSPTQTKQFVYLELLKKKELSCDSSFFNK